jgi:general secretion pathway protein C
MILYALIRRHFWVVGATTVVACSALAANAVAHLIAATALSESAQPIQEPPASPHIPAAAPAGVADRPGWKDPAARLVDRNIFCSRCTPVDPGADASGAATTPPEEPILTTLPLRLIATQLWSPTARSSATTRRSFATIRNTSTARQGAYSLGDQIPGAGRLTRIAGTFVEFESAGSKRTERIALFEGTPPPQRTAPAPPRLPAGNRAARSSKKNELLQALDAGVRRLDDTRFEVERSLVTKVLANPVAAGRGARIVPSIRNGRPDGFKLYRVRPSSVYARLGLKSGDTIHAVNGFELTSMDKALEVYTKVRESSNLAVSITRRGKPLTLKYTIR